MVPDYMKCMAYYCGSFMLPGGKPMTSMICHMFAGLDLYYVDPAHIIT